MSAVNRYSSEPTFKLYCDAKRDMERGLVHTRIDKALIANDKRWPSNWTEGDKKEASERLMKRHKINNKSFAADAKAASVELLSSNPAGGNGDIK
jgi:hypothetical protein